MELERKIASKEFEGLLTKLLNGAIDYVSYGDPESPAYTGLRIRCLLTQGGRQFAVKGVTAFGQENSGEYVPVDAPLMLKLVVMRRLVMYERIDPRMERARAKLGLPPPRELSFFPGRDKL